MGDKLAPENIGNGRLESLEPQAGTAGQEAGEEHLSSEEERELIREMIRRRAPT